VNQVENKPEEPESSYDRPPEPYVPPKQRHGCLTAWLYYIIAGNTISIVLNFLQINTIAEALKISPIWVLAALGASVLNIIAAILLFNWKKIGFHITLASAIFVFVLNIVMDISIWQALIGLVGVIVLFIVLKIGSIYNKGWPQLE
jgi:hypothetical protein